MKVDSGGLRSGQAVLPGSGSYRMALGHTQMRHPVERSTAQTKLRGLSVITPIAEMLTKQTDLSLKFLGLSEIRSDLPLLQADSVTGRSAPSIMSRAGAAIVRGDAGVRQRKVLVS